MLVQDRPKIHGMTTVYKDYGWAIISKEYLNLYVSVTIWTIESFYRTLCKVCCVIRLKFRFQVATNSGLSESGNGIFSSQSLAHSGLEKKIDKNQIQQPPSKSEGIFTCNLKLRNNNLWQFGIAQRQICHRSKKLLHNVWIINREQSA
jgi:hypothetical protein